MADILADFFEQFTPEERTFIRAKQAEARIVLLKGQDEAQILAAGSEFIGYQKILIRRVDPVCTESLEKYLLQMGRICAALLSKYGAECENALAQWLVEAERLAWISLGKQLGNVNSGKTKGSAEPSQQYPTEDNREAQPGVMRTSRSAEALKHELAPRLTFLLGSELAEGTIQQPERLSALPGQAANDTGGRPVEPSKPWAENLRKAREKTGLSRSQVAIAIRKKYVPITADSIKKHEEGAAKPRANVRSAYAAVYQVLSAII